MLNENDFIRVRLDEVGEWTQAAAAPVPEGAVRLDEPALTPAGTTRPDIPWTPEPADQVPPPESPEPPTATAVVSDPAAVQTIPSPARPPRPRTGETNPKES